MQRFITSRLRFAVIGVLMCSTLIASTPCAWMMAASSTPGCCKKRSPSVVRERCHEQSISACCAEKPQVVAVTSSAAWSTDGLAPQAPIHTERRCLYSVAHAGAPDSPSTSYLQHSVLRI